MNSLPEFAAKHSEPVDKAVWSARHAVLAACAGQLYCLCLIYIPCFSFFFHMLCTLVLFTSLIL